MWPIGRAAPNAGYRGAIGGRVIQGAGVRGRFTSEWSAGLAASGIGPGARAGEGWPRYGEGVAGPAVAVRGVRVGYGSFAVLEDVDMTVAAGEIVAVTGVNGAGKSTLRRFSTCRC